MTSQLLRSFAGDAAGLALRDDVRFRSPFADYHGRDDVAHLVSLIARVLGDVTLVRELASDDGVRATVFTARVGDAELQGVLEEQHDDDGALAEAMLLLRPYAVLRRAMAQMGELLEASPLPSAAA